MTTRKKEPETIVLYRADDADPALVHLAEEALHTKALSAPPAKAEEIYLQADADGFALVENGRMLRGDFAPLLPRSKPGNLNRELLVRAARIKGLKGNPTAVDATAGMGEDAFLLAAAGFSVLLYERNPVIALLLHDALAKSQRDPRLEPITSRMELRREDSIAALTRLAASPEIVVLDPMFPSRQKSGLIKKKFQLLQQLEQPCTDEKALLDAAISCHPERIVIKRPLKGPHLADVVPSYSIKGNSIRYDCIVMP